MDATDLNSLYKRMLLKLLTRLHLSHGLLDKVAYISISAEPSTIAEPYLSFEHFLQACSIRKRVNYELARSSYEVVWVSYLVDNSCKRF